MILFINSSLLLVIGFACVAIHADTPANCSYEDIRGTWMFSMGKGNDNNNVDCSSKSVAMHQMKIHLSFPDVAVDEYDNKGFWTIIYNQGFEVVVGGRKFFAFSKFADKKSFCGVTMQGWYHNVLGRDWGCYVGNKLTSLPAKPATPQTHSLFFGHNTNSAMLARSINSAHSSWTAVKYKHLDGTTNAGFVAMAGGKRSVIASRPNAAPLTEEHKRIMATLPEVFDWRSVDGQNFVSPVRNQGACGSCYSFASLAMIEARVKIMSNNTQTPVFSPQDIVECSPYSQGCDGGFPYLIGGKYAEDFGLVEEKWNPYKGVDGSCSTKAGAPRHYATKYSYVGGYYGACNEAVMMQAMYENGPVAVGFEVYKDFMSYSSGIYHHTTQLGVDKFRPFELTNHAVLVVGWGKDSSGQKYWVVKNSWGTNWGQNGFFKIRKGTDECGIESMAVEAFPVLTFGQ